MTNPQFVLASNSPRRKELLALTGLAFAIKPADINEDVLPDEGAQVYVLRLAREKGEAVRADAPEAIVIAADTTVVLDGEILAKPADTAEAREMLTSLRGRNHVCFSGLSLTRTVDGAQVLDLAETEVPMRNYSDEEMEAYIASGDPLDKAGAYAIQHPGFHPVENLQGCRANVVGLPLCHLQRNLEKWGIHLDVDLPAACQQFLNYDCPVTDKILAWEL
jgi:MAF protein